MARPAKSTEKLQQYSLRLPSSLKAEAKYAGKRMGLEDADALRFAASIGFRLLRMIDYDVETAVAEYAIQTAIRKRSGK